MSFLNHRSAPLLMWPALLSLPVVGAILGLIGPFGSYTGMALAPRVGHFVLCVTIIGSASLVLSYLIARRYFQGFWPLWAALGLDAALALPSAALVYGSLTVFAPDVLVHISPMTLLWQNLLMTLVFRGASLILSWRRIREGAAMLPVADSPPGLGDRLPRELRREPVLALSAEDHYLRVHTPKGEALIHMTLAEAMTLMPRGFQVHRSHWVAETAIRKTADGRIELVTGLSLPLSRHRRKAFEAWRDDAEPEAGRMA